MSNPGVPEEIADWLVTHPAVSESLDRIALELDFQIIMALMNKPTNKYPIPTGDLIIALLDHTPIAIIHPDGTMVDLREL